MPKLNGVLMVLGALAVIGAAGALSLRPSGSHGPDPAKLKTLLRHLSDPDPDVRREAEEGFRELGKEAQPALLQASKSEDRVLADQARKLLAGLAGASEIRKEPSPFLPKGGASAFPKAAALLEPPNAELLEFSLVCSGPPEHVDPAGTILVQFQNRSSVPVLILLQPESVDRPVGFFEIEGESGGVTRVAARPLPVVEGASRQVAALPGSTEMLFSSSPLLAETASRKGTRKLRFVYEASDRSPYRDLVRPGDEGVPLPPLRFTSKTYLVGPAR